MARILVVDDQPQFLKMLEVLLTQKGYVVTTAVDGYDALEKVKDQIYEMIITDAAMPGGVNGYDLVKTLRADPKLRDLPMILLTGRREKRDVERGIQSGVDDYCIKPIDPDIFLAKVEALLAKKFKGAVSFPEFTVSEPDEYKFNLRIVGVSEVGLSFMSPQPFHPGTKIQLGGSFFQKIGIDSPTLRVMGCEPKDHEFQVQVQYIGVGESTLQPLRIWLRNRSMGRAS